MNRGKEIVSDKKCGDKDRCSEEIPRSEDEHSICIVATSANNTSVPPLYQCGTFKYNVPVALIAGVSVIVVVIVVLLVVFVVLTYRYYKNKSFIKAVRRVEDDTLGESQDDAMSFVGNMISDSSDLYDGDNDKDNTMEEDEYDEYDDDSYDAEEAI